MTYRSDYPNEPIGVGNPYYCCCACGRSDPEINGRIEGHYEWCPWRKEQEATIRATSSEAVDGGQTDGAVKVNPQPEVPKGDPIAALLEIRRLVRKLMDEPEKWSGNAVLTRIFGLTVDGTHGVTSPEWTDADQRVHENMKRIVGGQAHPAVIGWVRDEDGTCGEPSFLRGPARPPRDLKGNYRPVALSAGFGAHPVEVQPTKKWPFVESPGDFTERLAMALNSGFDLLGAVRHVLIEEPPTLAATPTPLPAAPAVPKLAVWFGSMPESNGKANWTAVLHSGDFMSGFTLAKSEHKDRVRYDADRIRFLLGELDKEPFILDYDGNLIEHANDEAFAKWEAACAAPAVQGWMPIESAPKDGTRDE